MVETLAHISDLHVSAFGDTFHDVRSLVRRSKTMFEWSPERHAQTWLEGGWRLLTTNGHPDLILVDPEGYVHRIPSERAARKRHLAVDDATDAFERAVAFARSLDAVRASAMARELPQGRELHARLTSAPANVNLRFLRVMEAIESAQVDTIAVTGDLTDNSEGYDLLEAALLGCKKRILAVPGNHDLYLFPLAGSARPRPTRESKRARWVQFAHQLGLELDPCGAWLQHWDDIAVIGLDSCARPQRRFFRHNGAIGQAQMDYVRGVAAGSVWQRAKHRLVMLHHHLVLLASTARTRPKSEFGMRLDDGDAAVKLFNDVGVTLVMHGHRHISEERQPPGCHFRLLAAPSATLGCRSGDAPSFWRVELGERVHAERVRVPLTSVEHLSSTDVLASE